MDEILFLMLPRSWFIALSIFSLTDWPKSIIIFKSKYLKMSHLVAISGYFVYVQTTDVGHKSVPSNHPPRHGWVNTWLSNFLNWKEEPFPDSPTPLPSPPSVRQTHNLSWWRCSSETKTSHFAHFDQVGGLTFPVASSWKIWQWLHSSHCKN